MTAPSADPQARRLATTHPFRKARPRSHGGSVVGILAGLAVLAGVIAPTSGAATGGSISAAVAVGSQANPNEAPWAVRLKLARPGYGSGRCTGQVVRPGLILTAAHCFDMAGCSGVKPTKFGFLFAFNRTQPRGTRASFKRHPQYQCRSGNDNLDINDVAVIRFKPDLGVPALPLASPGEIGAFANHGVTLFGAGRCCWTRETGYQLPKWVRKSKDGGFHQNPYCQFASDLCFRATGSLLLPGDSGGAFVGWAGGWKLLGVASGGWSADGQNQIAAAASLADPTVRSWVDQMIAAYRYK